MNGRMDGMDFMRKVSTTTAKGKRVGREMGLYGTLLQRSRRYFRHSWYFRDAGYAAWPLDLPLLLLALALFLLGLHRRQDLQLLRDEVGRIRSGGEGPGGISVGTERETRGMIRENVPHPENAHDGFPTTDFFLLFLFPLAILDSPEISL
jgi:hypothetical protein